MSETPPPAQPPAQPPADPPADPVAPTSPPPVEPAAPRTRLRDRLFGLRALVAVAVAGVLLGGLAGFGIHAATDDGRDGRDGRVGRFGPGQPGSDGGPGPGQRPALPPATAPRDDAQDS